jgi:molecular chaperone DnaJ
MGLLDNLGSIFKKTVTPEKVLVRKSGVRISDRPKKSPQETNGTRIFPRESPRTNANGGQNGDGITVDFSGFGDIFDSFIGSPPKSGPRPGPDLFFTLEITPQTAGSGTDYDLEVTHTEPCPSCDGSGSGTRRTGTCSVCKGGRYEQKEIVSPQGTFVQMKTCPACKGRGVVPEDACRECRSTGHVHVQRIVTVHIPAGTSNYAQLCFEGLGDAGDYQGKNGDLILQVCFC